MEKRVFLTIAVCLGIMLIWQYFFMPPRKPGEHPATPPAATQPAAQEPAQAPTVPVAAAPTEVPIEAPATPEEHLELAGTDLRLQLSNHGGTIDEATVLTHRDADHPDQPLRLVTESTLYLADVTRPDGHLGLLAYRKTSESPKESRYERDDGGLQVSKTYQLTSDGYTVALTVSARNTTGEPMPLQPTAAIADVVPEAARKGHMFAPPARSMDTECLVDDKVHRYTHGSVKDRPSVPGAVKWVALDQRYFLLAVAPTDGGAGSCGVAPHGDNGVMVSWTGATVTVAPGAEQSWHYTLYLGPKSGAALASAGVELERSVDYDVMKIPLGFLCRPMLAALNFFQGALGSYGLAILMLTLVVKLLLLPVTQKSFQSMERMKALQPKLTQIKERFPDDKQRQSMEMMNLYRQEGVNPFGGCLPMLLQMPVWFALYRTLWSAVELYQKRFLWMPDLTAPDPTYVMPLLLGAVMFVQQRMMPPAMDNQQAKIMMWMMPAMFTLMMLALPSGLVIYIFANTILTILQQAYIKRVSAKARS